MSLFALRSLSVHVKVRQGKIKDKILIALKKAKKKVACKAENLVGLNVNALSGTTSISGLWGVGEAKLENRQ